MRRLELLHLAATYFLEDLPRNIQLEGVQSSVRFVKVLTNRIFYPIFLQDGRQIVVQVYYQFLKAVLAILELFELTESSRLDLT